MPSLKKIDNHMHQVALFYMHYKLWGVCIRPFKVTPAMEAGISSHIWSISGDRVIVQ